MGTYDIAATGAWGAGTIRVTNSVLDNEHVYMDRGVGYSSLGAVQIPLETAESIGRELLQLVEEARMSPLWAEPEPEPEPEANVVRIVTRFNKNEYQNEYVAARVNGEYDWVVTGSECEYSWEDLIEYLTDENETVVSITPLKEGK